jgi:NADP-dependent 3-hydroxy acid dehydrogenase YdfG
MMACLSGQVAVVTGAGSGIGRAIAKALAAQGASVCLVGRTRKKLEDTAASLQALPARAAVMPVDLTVDDQMDRLRDDLTARYPGVDILVLSAGEIAHGAVKNASLEAFDVLYRANVRAPFRLIQLLLPTLKASSGQIVVINSSVGLTAPANISQFSSTQHALKAVTDSLRNEVNADGIRVLSIYPGRTATPRQEALYAKSGQEYHPERLLQPEDIASVVVNALDLPRTAEVTDISIRPLLKSY